MKLAFAGTPEFAAVMLDALIDSRHAVEAVFTPPDARAGRGKRVTKSPVKQRAAAAGIRVFQPESMHSAEAVEPLAALAPDAMVVAAYGFLLPASILAMPRLGCINVHASILPRWRGAAPVHHAILAGDRCTGVSIMQMDAGLDTGPILATRTCAISADDTSGSLTGRLAELGAATLVDTLDTLEIGTVEARPQDDASTTPAPKLSKTQAAIDWTLPAARIGRMVRAFDPWPVAHTRAAGTGTPVFRIWRAEPVDGDSSEAPGTVLAGDESALIVAAGQGVVRITEIQPAGARRMAAAEFVRGRWLAPGTRLGCEPG
ncbi:MAG: methionyl-tRNA formyltransferase [Thiotrichales bacterium]|nr:methionyl-tRNA formyltransferase [Thiotrichales bacterium]MCY4350517.1 methionyl-tRNA formyltransferase [Thiotrichales bacterium]